MDQDERSLEDCDGPVASFRGATLRIQPDNICDDVAMLPLIGDGTSDNDGASRRKGNSATPSDINSGYLPFYLDCTVLSDVVLQFQSFSISANRFYSPLKF